MEKESRFKREIQKGNSQIQPMKLCGIYVQVWESFEILMCFQTNFLWLLEYKLYKFYEVKSFKVYFIARGQLLFRISLRDGRTVTIILLHSLLNQFILTSLYFSMSYKTAAICFSKSF